MLEALWAAATYVWLLVAILCGVFLLFFICVQFVKEYRRCLGEARREQDHEECLVKAKAPEVEPHKHEPEAQPEPQAKPEANGAAEGAMISA